MTVGFIQHLYHPVRILILAMPYSNTPIPMYHLAKYISEIYYFMHLSGLSINHLLENARNVWLSRFHLFR